MLCRPTRLSIKHPSPSTISFTASNAFSKNTISAKIGLLIGILFRISFFTIAIMLFMAKFRWVFLADGVEGEMSPMGVASMSGQLHGWRTHVPGLMIVRGLWNSSSLAASVSGFADRMKVWVLAGVGAVLCNLAFRKWHTEETLLVIRGLGIQTSTSSPTYLSTTTTRFIPTTQIQDVVIHEAFRNFEVRFYLAILVEGEKEVVVVFPNLLPNRNILEEVWRGTRRCLYDSRT